MHHCCIGIICHAVVEKDDDNSDVDVDTDVDTMPFFRRVSVQTVPFVVYSARTSSWLAECHTFSYNATMHRLSAASTVADKSRGGSITMNKAPLIRVNTRTHTHHYVCTSHIPSPSPLNYSQSNAFASVMLTLIALVSALVHRQSNATQMLSRSMRRKTASCSHCSHKPRNYGRVPSTNLST